MNIQDFKVHTETYDNGEKLEGILHSEIKSKLDPKEWARFSDFMVGQTHGSAPSLKHEAIYYIGDVHRFLNKLPVID